MLGDSPKFKYQSLKFKNRLQKAKTYKRQSLPVSENKYYQLLQKWGLTTWQAKTATLLGVCFAVYILLFPNFLTIKTIELTGTETAKAEQIKVQLQGFLQNGILLKNNNLLLASKKGIKNFLEKQSDIISVSSIKKVFPNKLVINIKPRIEKYILSCDSETAIYSNDGKFLRIFNSSSTIASSFIKLLIKAPCPGNTYAIEAKNLEIFENTPTALTESTISKVSYFEFSPSIDPDIKIVLENNEFLLIDSNIFNKILLNNFKTLYSNLSNDEKKKVFYMDLRIPNKAFVCFKGNSCTEQTIIKPKNGTTTTIDSIINSNLQ